MTYWVSRLDAWSVAEVGGGSLGLGRQLVSGDAGGLLRRGRRRRVVPDTAEDTAGRVRDHGVALGTGRGADRCPVAVLGEHPAPGLATRADAGVEGLQGRGEVVGVLGEHVLTRRVRRLGTPLVTQEHHVDLGPTGRDARPDQATHRQTAAVADELLGGCAGGPGCQGGGRRRAEGGHARHVVGPARHGSVAVAVMVARGHGQDGRSPRGGRRCRPGDTGGHPHARPSEHRRTDHDQGTPDAPVTLGRSMRTGHVNLRYGADPYVMR